MWKDEEDTDQMEMPCLCDCGNWFDLNDGYTSNTSNIVVCQECYRKQTRASQIEEEIQTIEIEISILEELPNTKREVKALRKQIDKLQDRLMMI